VLASGGAVIGEIGKKGEGFQTREQSEIGGDRKKTRSETGPVGNRKRVKMKNLKTEQVGGGSLNTKRKKAIS